MPKATVDFEISHEVSCEDVVWPLVPLDTSIVSGSFEIMTNYLLTVSRNSE